MVGLRGVERVGLQTFLVAAFALGLIGRASANPIVIPPGYIAATVADSIYILFLTNLPIDILLFSAIFLLVLWKFKSPLRGIPKGPNSLVASVILAGIIIAVAGSLIDFYGFYTLDSTWTHFYVPEMTWENMAIAGVGVFVSVYAISLGIGMLKLLPSLIPAGVITALNFAVWIVMDKPLLADRIDFGDWVILLAGTVFLFVPPVMFGIVHVHGKKGGRP